MSIRKHRTRDGRTTYYVYVATGEHENEYVGKATTKEAAQLVERQARDRAWKARQGLLPPEDVHGETLGEMAAPWIETRRTRGLRSWKDDHYRMKRHLVPFFGKRRLREITPALLKDFIQSRREMKLSEQTILLTLRLLGRFFREMIENGRASRNPVAILDKHSRPHPVYDSRTVPFLRTKDDIRNVFLALDEEIRPLFAVGVFAGLRTGEVLALSWDDIDLEKRIIHVQRSVGGPLKDKESRLVPVNDTLLGVLRERRRRSFSGKGLLGKPGPAGIPGTHKKEHTLGAHIREALATAKLPHATWYQCTRHTFASHWIMDGRPIAKLAQILGHSTTWVTERYVHLVPGQFTPEDYAAVSVDLTPTAVVSFRSEQRENNGKRRAGKRAVTA